MKKTKINRIKFSKTALIVLALILLVCIGSFMFMNRHDKKANSEALNTGQVSNSDCNPLLDSSCKDTSNTQGLPIEHWIQSPAGNGNSTGDYNSQTQISSCAYDAENPPRSSLPPGQISPAEKQLQDKARTFQNANEFNNYIQSLNDTDKHQAICILDDWTTTQFYNDAVSRE